MGRLVVALTRANLGWPPRDLDTGVWQVLPRTLSSSQHSKQQAKKMIIGT
jgi:hypothetical protein